MRVPNPQLTKMRGVHYELCSREKKERLILYGDRLRVIAKNVHPGAPALPVTAKYTLVVELEVFIVSSCVDLLRAEIFEPRALCDELVLHEVRYKYNTDNMISFRNYFRI